MKRAYVFGTVVTFVHVLAGCGPSAEQVAAEQARRARTEADRAEAEAEAARAEAERIATESRPFRNLVWGMSEAEALTALDVPTSPPRVLTAHVAGAQRTRILDLANGECVRVRLETALLGSDVGLGFQLANEWSGTSGRVNSEGRAMLSGC